ncbi:MAG: hypothetical protein LBB50_05775 [Oscillospiraceae bacterium]|jgi:hypothetical protein|nr:hypothetical protein [Oscillospiraceae bacterium]
MSKTKIARRALLIIGLLLLAGWLVLWLGFHRTGLLVTPAALALVGILLSLEYSEKKLIWLVRVLQVLAFLTIPAAVVTWFLSLPHGYLTALYVVALAANLPLAVFGFKRATDTIPQ